MVSLPTGVGGNRTVMDKTLREKMMQIALVSRSGEALKAYLRFFEAHGAHPIHFPSISELYRKLPDMLISGLMVDMATLVRAVETEKFMLQTI